VNNGIKSILFKNCVSNFKFKEKIIIFRSFNSLNFKTKILYRVFIIAHNQEKYYILYVFVIILFEIQIYNLINLYLLIFTYNNSKKDLNKINDNCKINVLYTMFV
jgi:hypothetical protein